MFINWELMTPQARTAYLTECNNAPDAVYAFDTETSRISPAKDSESRVYIWQFNAENIGAVYGRHLESFAELLAGLTKKQLIWVHNLSYDACYLWNIVKFAREHKGGYKVTLRGTHRFQQFTIENGVTFKCSLVMYGTNLRTFMEQMNVPAEYQKTDMDYDGLLRNSNTPLTEDELIYCRNDVLGLTIAIRNLCTNTGDTVRTLPNTSTGFIRRDMKTALGIKGKTNPLSKYMNDGDILKALIASFRGGNTHCNRWHTGDVLDCHSFDITSAYPAAMVREKFPGKFYPAEKKSTPKQFEALARQGVRHDARIAHLYHVVYHDIECRYDVPVPYISEGSIICGGGDVVHSEEKPFSLQYDNGRVLEAVKVDMWINEIDAAIIASQYTCRKVDILDEYVAEYMPLPESMRNVMIKYYIDKCQLQPDSPEYHNSKRKLNAGYGLLAMNPYRDNVAFDPDGGEESFMQILAEEAGKQDFPYQWGCWVTSWCRAKLQSAIDCIPPFNVYYCDTDSVKFTGEIPEALTKLIDGLKQDAIENNIAFENIKGKMKYLGAFDYEGHHKMKSLGSKKYVTENEDGTFTATIAGANKQKASEIIKSFDQFKEGLYIPDKLIPKYFDKDYHSVTLYDAGYELRLTVDYKDLINSLTLEMRDELANVYEEGL